MDLGFLVMGAGSIGSVIGGLLHLDGNDVYLIGRGAHIETVKTRGLLITGIWGRYRIENINAGTSMIEALGQGFDPEWVILSVKSHDTKQALSELTPLLEKTKGIISLQNGLGNLEAIEAAAPKKAVGGRVIFGARTVEPGHVEVTVCADDVLLGPAYGGPKTEEVQQVCKIFSNARIPCRYEEEILSFIWDKVLYNVCLNALATILRTNYGGVSNNKEAWLLVEKLTEEFYAVAKAEGINMVSRSPQEYLERLRNTLIPPTREHRSSMQEDIEHGRKTEIDALNGAIWRLGEKHGIESPANETLTRLIKAIEKESGSNKP